jgi:VWFA-related protein
MNRWLLAPGIVLLALLCGGFALYAQTPPAKPAQEPAKQKKPDQRPAEEQDEPVQLGARLVVVPFTATDKRNAILSDIRLEELQVLENGRPQELFKFDRQTDLPLTIALLIDISGSQEYTLADEKHAAAQFFRSMVRPTKDVVAVIQFRDEAILLQDFTSTLARMEWGLEQVRYTPRTTTDNSSTFGGTSLYDAVYVTCDELLGRQAGRRTVLLMTDGVDTTSHYKLSDAIDRGLRSEVTIYSIGIGDRYRFGLDEGTLKKLSEQTGGRAYFPRGSDALRDAFRQIEEELRSQYFVAYYPSNVNLDGTFRKIEIRLPARKEVKVRHRLGYYSPKPSS